MSDYMEPRDQHKKQGYIWVLIALAIIFLLWAYSGISNAADLPYYADLMFTDQADLDTQMDSVLAVCDSAMTKARVDSLVMDGWDVYNPVTCRRFAGLTVWNMPYDDYHPHGLFLYEKYPGKARLWWWEKKKRD